VPSLAFSTRDGFANVHLQSDTTEKVIVKKIEEIVEATTTFVRALAAKPSQWTRP
jgi:hypothetical protein